MDININIIKKQGDLFDLIIRNNQILEMYHRDGAGHGELFYNLYNPIKNTISEIEPSVSKTDLVILYVSYMPCSNAYYATIDPKDNGSLDINIYAYDFDHQKSELMCSFRESEDVLTGKKRIRVFVLSPTQLLIQTELLDMHGADALMGNILFSQTLYDISTNTPIEITEENLNNNGINSIVPLNENEIMIKTGFSFLEDSRLTYGSEKDALIESVYTTTNAKFTADIALRKNNIDMNLLTSTYYDKYILKPEVKDDYIVYNIVDVKNHESDCIFYNFVTGEMLRGKNSDLDSADMRIAYIVDNTPYVRKYIENSCEFVNLSTAENDISFYDEDFVDICGDLFITTRRHGRRNHMRVYRYPHMDLLLEEKCNYIAGISQDNNYYLYIDK